MYMQTYIYIIIYIYIIYIYHACECMLANRI